MEEIRALSHGTTNEKVLSLVTRGDLHGRRVLDVGAGEGYFCRLLGAYLRSRYDLAPGEVVRACDRHPEIFRYAEVPCDPIDPSGRLPYDGDSFDAVVSVEVVEHVEDQFSFVRELHRVTRPAGRVIVTTPNLLNINSRLRYLHSGFWLLFNPLSLDTQDAVHTSGHVNPITFYYLAYLFHRAGFREVRVHFDRRKRSGVMLTLLVGIYVALGNALFRAHLKRKNPALYRANAALLDRNNSWDMLTSRSIIVEAIK